jgi:Uma2 family endonuclease
MVYSTAMTAAPSHFPKRFTLAEYLEFEDAAEEKHEFHDGEILAMSGSSPEHALITASTLRAIGNQLEGKPCRVYSSDLKVGQLANSRIYNPHGTVVCGPLEFHPSDPKRQIATNPRVIVEVLSPTTEAYDRGKKFRDYRTIESLAEYVLISQTAPIVETFLRQPDGSWLIGAAYTGLDATAAIRSIQVELKLSDIYANVTFPPPAPSPDPREREDL